MSDKIYNSKIKIPYTWSVGEVGSKFLRALRDDKKILANTCTKTQEVFCPPKKFSPHTMKENTKWVELSGHGKVLSYTKRCYENKITKDLSYNIYGLILLEGASHPILHFLSEIEFEDVKVNMAVKAVFKEQREGHILDIKYFKPISK